MDNISESTSKKSDFVGLISDISEQVNLLSLNAAIKAARADDHGKGFAFSAEEISTQADALYETIGFLKLEFKEKL